MCPQQCALVCQALNNEREILILHEAASCGIENFEFIVSERVQVLPIIQEQWAR